MGTLYIRSFSDDLLVRIDELAERKGLSRSQYVTDILATFVSLQDDSLHKLLPVIVRSEVKEELKSFEISLKDTMNLLLITTLRLQKTNEKLNGFLFPELEKLEIDGMNSEQILAIINSETRENDDEFMQEIIEKDVDF